ncbi:MAG TPA: hypothetical protein VIL20_06655 [Sandaracinaceae bacterium]
MERGGAPWWIALALAALAACGSPPLAPGRKLRVRELSAPRSRAVGDVAGMTGDWTIEGGGLRALIGGLRRPRRQRGRVLALETAGAAPSDDFEWLAPIVIEGERASELVVERVERGALRDRPAVRVVGRAALPRGELRVERLYTVADVDGTLAIFTRVNREVLVAERASWGGSPPFVPFVGRPDDGEWHDASWMGTESPARAIVIATRSGRGKVRGDPRPHDGHELVGTTELAVPATPRASVRTLVSTSREGLAGALRRAGWARGRPFREATAAVVPLPPSAAVRVASAEGPWLRARVPPSGRLQVPLPNDDRPLTVRAIAYGHAASEPAPIAPGARVRLEVPASGRLRVRALDEASGSAIPFRVRVIGEGSTATPDLGPVFRAAGARDVVASAGAPVEVRFLSASTASSSRAAPSGRSRSARSS